MLFLIMTIKSKKEGRKEEGKEVRQEKRKRKKGRTNSSLQIRAHFQGYLCTFCTAFCTQCIFPGRNSQFPILIFPAKSAQETFKNLSKRQ